MAKALKGLRYRRRAAEISQQVIADTLGIHVSTYNRIESGAIGLNLTEAVKLAEYFGCSVEDLL